MKNCFKTYSLRCILIGILACNGCQRAIDIAPPIARVVVFPTFGDLDTYFTFDGSTSNDDRSELWQFKFQWDFEGDGIWDTEVSSDPKYVWKYSSYGTKTVVLKVWDHEGNSNEDSCKILIAPNFDDSTFVDPRDGNQYRAVRIDNQWWMAENLRYGVEIPVGSLTSDNGIVEKFLYRDSSNNLISTSGYYNWDEATYYRKSIVEGICPEGWRLTNYYDYMHLYNRFVWYVNPYNLFKPGGSVGIDLAPDGLYSYFTGSFSFYDEGGLLIISEKNAMDNPYEHYVFWYHASNYFPHITYSEREQQVTYPIWWDRESGGDKMDFNKLAINVRCVKKVD